MVGFSYEKRPLKRARLGPPDVYPQDAKQREDELTAINVKQGFSHIPQISDEYGTAKNINLSAAKLGAFINGTISKKLELNALPDTGKRRPQVNTKDNFWPVTPRNKHIVETWMKDLAGTKPLSTLGKKVPIFNKREEIFLYLVEYSVPLLRASWFIKMTASYNSAISEAKTKKRQVPDPSQDWTISLMRCLKDILIRLCDWYNGGTGSLGSSNSNPGSNSSTGGPSSTPTHVSGALLGGPTSSIPEDGSMFLKQWIYCTDLAKHLYEEGLLDRFDWLQWIIDACDRARTLEDGAWKALVPLLLGFIPEIAHSELLARRLANLAARRLSTLFTEFDFPPSFNGPVQPPSTLLDHLQCPSHRSTVLTLVSALQVIVIECPTALVFSGNVVGSSNLSLNNSAGNPGSNNTASNQDVKNLPIGSPLDIIPISPSALPMPPRINNPIIRTQLRSAEDLIRFRSRAVEAKWACEEWQQSSASATLQKVLLSLEALDTYSFDKIDTTNTIEVLYSRVFANSPVSKENQAEIDAPIIILLCQWAVGPYRRGDHRPLVVAKLLEHRQTIVTSSTTSTTTASNNPDSEKSDQGVGSEEPKVEPMDEDAYNENSSSTPQPPDREPNPGSKATDDDENDGYNGLPIYHNLLFKYLDTDAPVLDDGSSITRSKFLALVHLFSSLIRHEIFSHDTYLCTLVARGDLSAIPPQLPTGGNSSSSNPSSGMQQVSSVATPGPGSQHGPGTPASVSSTLTPAGTTPHHDLMDESGNPRSGPLFQPLPRLQDTTPHNRQQDYDDRNIDDDLDRILQHITQEHMEPDSPKEDTGSANGFGSHHPQPPHSNSNSQSDSNNSRAGGGGSGTPMPGSQSQEAAKQSRHRQYVTHFQLPQDDAYQHEANQRHILLYGVGRSRDEAKHMVKKVSKDLTKLFTKKFCHDISDGSRVKKQVKNEISIENLLIKFQNLPFFDQHAVSTLTAGSIVEMLSSFAAGRNCYLPTVENIGFLTELMEVSLTVSSLVEMCVQILRELPDIENQLLQRSSPIAGQYTTVLLLQIIAVLRQYHSVLLLDTELVLEVWDSLVRILRRFTLPTDCTSAERCALAYMTDIHSSCNFLRSKNWVDNISPVAAKIRSGLGISLQPAESNHGFNNSFMTQCLDNPRRKVDASIIRQLNENPSCRYSFVCNSILSICNEADSERLNDLVSLCAEMTAVCPTLAPEWLGVLQSLCSPSRHSPAYPAIMTEVNVKDLSIHSSLATLTTMLVARQCFALQDIVIQAVPSLLKAWNDGNGPRDTDAEAGARLTCYLLLCLFKTQDNSSISSLQASSNSCNNILKYSCDRRLLSATHSSITLGAVLAALKAMLLLADAAIANERRKERSGLSSGELSISHILGTSDVLPSAERNNDAIRSENRTLASFALNSLQQMCSEPWVRQRCLHNPIELCQPDMLLDPIVSPRQAQRLLHLICYPELPIPEETLDNRSHIPKIMESLEQWNLREAWVALTLQNKQLLGNLNEHQQWLDTVARSALEVFRLGEEAGQEYIIPQTAAPSPAPGKSPRSGKKSQDQSAKTPPNSTPINSRLNASEKFKDGKGISATSAWLVAPLIEKLLPQVQGRVLRHAGNVLENTLWPKTPPKTTGLHSHLPFLALILTCLRGQDDQRETLLQSLLAQFTQLLQYAKEADAEGKTETLRDALRLRLSLVGAMFEAIQRSIQATAEWAVILTQLVTHSVVDLDNNSDVFYTVVDMITSLVHSTQVTEAGERVEETRKQNLNLIKKLKKELSDRNSESVKPLRQLLPLSKVQADIIVTQSTSIITDSKGNRVQSLEFVDKKPGLQVFEKIRVSPWELLEGQRNPSLSWGWFGAVKMERKQLRYEESHRLSKFHAHNLTKPFSHFLEPVPLPPEEIDVKPEIHLKEDILMSKPDTPMSMMSDQSPRGPIPKVAKPKAPRKKRLTKAQQQAAAAAAVQVPPPMNVPVVNNPPRIQTPPVQGGPNFVPGPNQMPGNPPAPNYPGAPPQWYNGQPPPPQQQQPPPQAQQTFYPQQPPQGPRVNQSSKAALHNLLRGRHPGTGPPGAPNQFQQFSQPGPGGPGPGPARHQILRQQLRAPPPGNVQMQGGFQAGPPGPQNPNPMFQSQQQQPGQQPPPQQMANQGMNPAYNTYNQGGMNTNVGVRQMGPRMGMPGPPGQQPQQGIGGPMQGGYGQMRPNMGGGPGQMNQGMMQNPGQMQMGQGQMVQTSMSNSQGQMGPGGVQSQGQMVGPGGGIQNQGQMVGPGGGMQNQGQMVGPGGGMQNQGQMGPGSGMQNQGQMGPGGTMQNQGQMVGPGGGMQNQGQMVGPGGGIQNQGQMSMGPGPNANQMGQGGGGMINQGHMGQAGMSNPGGLQMGMGPGVPNQQQRMMARQMMMQQQQQQQQQQRPQMHYNPNQQPGGY